MSVPIDITGNVIADPELRFSPKGDAYCTFTVVTSGRMKVGEKWEDTDKTFWRCIAFKVLAENVAESVSKGDRVIVEGKAAQEKDWVDKEGNKRPGGIRIRAEDVALSCKFHQVKVEKMQRGQQKNAFDDPWAGDLPS